MRTLLLSSVSALVVVGILGSGHHANATTWKNYANESMCLGVAGGSTAAGTALVPWSCDNSANQSWDLWRFSGDFSQLYTEESTSVDMCAALGNNGSIDNGTQLVIWQCSVATLDQGWYAEYVGVDANGHSCYYIMNEKAWNNGWGVKRVIAPGFWPWYPIMLWDYNSSATNQLWCAY